MQGCAGPYPALPVLCGLGQTTQRCFHTGFCGASVHLDYSCLVQERNECTSIVGVSVHQTLMGSEQTSRKCTQRLLWIHLIRLRGLKCWTPTVVL